MMRATPTGAVRDNLSHDIWINHGATEEVRRVTALKFFGAMLSLIIFMLKGKIYVWPLFLILKMLTAGTLVHFGGSASLYIVKKKHVIMKKSI